MAKRITLPKWNPKRGWVGGNSLTLYAFIDKITGKKVVRPGGGARKKLLGAPGDNASVRVATCGEARKLWQDPLHAGWKCKR